METNIEVIFKNFFYYKKEHFFVEDVSVKTIAEKFGTPVYIYSKNYIIDRVGEIKNAFKPINPLICYSVKANSNPEIIKILNNENCGMDVVSGGEILKCLKAKIKPEKIVYAGVGKKEEEIISGIKSNILMFNIESIAELQTINLIGKKYNKKISCALRINLDIETDTHHYTKTSKKETKFGFPIEQITYILNNKNHYKNINFKGLHFHLGSQLKTHTPYIEALKKLKIFLDKIKFIPETLDIGGGFGIHYKIEENIEDINIFGRKISEFILVNFKKTQIIIEPGRFIVGNTGILVSKVIYPKKTPHKNFLIIDAGMNDLIRPALYNSYHHIISEKKENSENILWDVVGPICETGDFLGKDRLLPENLKSKDIIIIASTGAYGFSMSSNYNGRPRCEEVLVDKKSIKSIRKRENLT
ncbi:MAG: diaminopimelate decarboxylase [Candidatus Omnitrophica bacterium]|jgi:diaminopimelate decarboxylase|nr:diaminopimelate decarboxylase [Candidatus Omnitrophota bacterium]